MVASVGRGMAVRADPGRVLVEQAVRSAGCVAPDGATRRIGGRGVDAQSAECRLAQPARVVIVGPEGDRPARRDPLEIRGRGLDAPAIGRPAMAEQPAVPVASAQTRSVRFGHERERRRERGGTLEVHLVRGQGRRDEVKVRVGHRGQRDLIVRELDDPGPGAGQRPMSCLEPLATIRPSRTASPPTQSKPDSPDRLAMRPSTMRSGGRVTARRAAATLRGRGRHRARGRARCAPWVRRGARPGWRPPPPSGHRRPGRRTSRWPHRGASVS